MPPAEDIQRYLSGTWRMMRGRADGLGMLDLSADGFWTSFLAPIYASPALLLAWVVVAHLHSMRDVSQFGDRISLIAALALVELAAWLLPLAGLALVVRRVGLERRFVPYVVSSNWSTVIFAWMMVPVNILRLFLPDAREVTDPLGSIVFLATLVLSWRLTNAAIARGPLIATLVFVAMIAASFAVMLVAQELFALIRLQ